MGVLNEPKTQRNAEIFEKNEQGVGVRVLAKEYQLSRERIRQIIDSQRQQRGGDNRD